MVNLKGIREQVKSMLKEGLSPAITYHDTEHSLDVARQALIIAKEEGVVNEQDLLELEIAALYHDTGFISAYKTHEVKSCEMAREHLPAFGVDERSINNICDIIMATRLPHTPKNQLQKIICDADLDYLGREDFSFINEKLRKEFFEYNIVNNEKEWLESTISFLQRHSYFTGSSQKRRSGGKLAQLEYLLKKKRDKNY